MPLSNPLLRYAPVMTRTLSFHVHVSKTMVDLGCDFYVQAVVPDTQWIYVHVGLGFQAQMTLAEAITFSMQQETALSSSVAPLTDRVVRLKARIKCVVGAIDEIMSRPSSIRERSR